MPGGHAGHEDHPDPDGAKNHCAAHVRLDENEAGRDGCQNERNHEDLYLMYVRLPVREITGESDDDQQFGDLRGLDLLSGYGEPAPRAVGGITDAEHGNKHDDGDGVETD